MTSKQVNSPSKQTSESATTTLDGDNVAGRAVVVEMAAAEVVVVVVDVEGGGDVGRREVVPS